MQERTRIKVCGLTREEDVDAAVRCGADAIGFVLYAASARHVSVERAAVLAKQLPPFVTPVALMVNATDALIAAAVRAIPNLLLQFHGDETLQRCTSVARPFIRAARMRVGFDLLDFASSIQALKPFWSMPTSTDTVAAERSSIGLSFPAACPFQSFCLVGCMPEM